MTTPAYCCSTDRLANQEIDRLRQALAQAEAANHAKSVFIAKLGHELKTPAGAIVGLAQLIRMRGAHAPEASAEAGWLAQIERLGWHMSEVIDTLLQLGPCGTGSLRAAGETFEVFEVMGEALRIVEGDAARRAITIGIVGDVRASVTADRAALRQVLVNLLSNAIKYNQPGGRVCLSVRGGECVRITVRDTGPGLSAEQRTRLFHAFDRLGAEHSEVAGHGLGLLLCRDLLQAMDGCIDVDSEPGAGCTFTVTLPGRAR